MPDELKPCPWCGETPILSDVLPQVCCDNEDCPTQPYTELHRSEADAIAAWNTRKEVRDDH